MSYCSSVDPSGTSYLRASFTRSLDDFTNDSSSTFRIIHTIPSTPTPPSPSSPLTNLKTLYVLDSSFNPPTNAHATIARNAVLRDQGARPARLLFLLATQNADKEGKPAVFEDRLVMMSLCAEGLRESLRGRTGSSPSAPASTSHTSEKTDVETNRDDISIDIAVTKHPFFMDKAAAIDQTGIYGDAQQVHVTGYDTITRIFNTKYYPDDRGLSVLQPFLARHRLRVCYRVGGGGEQERQRDREGQEGYVGGIGDGSREGEGMKREWSGMVQLVDDAAGVEGVSSTVARGMVRDGEWEGLEGVVGGAVARFVREGGIYGQGG